MDYGLLNALGISFMMIFGLWAYQQGYRKRNVRKGEKKEQKKNHGE